MKTQFKSLFSAALFLLSGTVALAQSNAEEVPGDNFSLEGALELFKKSASPQEFEQLLNSPDSKVNNLDLNGDGEIDYIRVIDKTEGNVHAFILQAVVSKNESQDVAVIELEKKGNGEAVLQIVGDADVYGIETIIEPTEEVRVNAGASTARTVVNVWAWPSVQYVYGPSYAVWVSPWSWAYYPGWYRPWRPVAYYVYDPFWAPYRPYYSVCFRHRVVYAHHIYRPYRSTSVIVYNRHSQQINTYRNTSRGYRHDRGDYARGARAGRYEADSRTRSSYNSNNGRRSGSNDTRTSWERRSNDERNSNSRSRSRSYDNNTRDNSRTSETRTRTRSNSSDNSRSSHESRQRSTPQRQMQQSQPQRQRSTPQMNRAPQQQRSNPPSNNGGGGTRRGRNN